MATQKEVSEHLFLKDLSGRGVRRWHKQPGFPVPRGTGGYDLDAVRKWYIDYCKAMGSQNDRPDELDEKELEVERLLLVREQRIDKQLSNAVKEGKLIPIDAGREILAKICAQIGAVLDSLPLNIKRRHPELEQKIIDGIKAEVITCQNAATRLDDLIDEVLDDFIGESETQV